MRFLLWCNPWLMHPMAAYWPRRHSRRGNYNLRTILIYLTPWPQLLEPRRIKRKAIVGPASPDFRLRAGQDFAACQWGQDDIVRRGTADKQSRIKHIHHWAAAPPIWDLPHSVPQGWRVLRVLWSGRAAVGIRTRRAFPFGDSLHRLQRHGWGGSCHTAAPCARGRKNGGCGLHHPRPYYRTS